MVKPVILITGARSIVALHMARSFTAAGYDVHMADCSSAMISRMSASAQHVHRYASPRHNLAQFTADIQSIMQQINPGIVIPTCEEVFYLACPGLKRAMKNKLFAPPLETLKTLHAKDRFIAACAAMGLPVPETHTISSQAQIDTVAADTHEWVFKRRYSRFGAKTLIGPERRALLGISHDADNPWLMQRRIHGTEISFYAIAKNGKLTAFAPYISDWRLKGSASYAFFPVDAQLSDRLKEFAQRLAAGFAMNGQFSCDLMVDEKGAIWPLECNPRTTSGLHLLPDDAQVAACLSDASGDCHAAGTQASYQSATFASYGLVKAITEKRLNEWIKIFRHGRDVMSVQNDRLPILGALIDALIFKCSTIGKKLSLSQATTADIEWNGEPLE